jgi:hypothetical protein
LAIASGEGGGAACTGGGACGSACGGGTTLARKAAVTSPASRERSRRVSGEGEGDRVGTLHLHHAAGKSADRTNRTRAPCLAWHGIFNRHESGRRGRPCSGPVHQT